MQIPATCTIPLLKANKRNQNKLKITKNLPFKQCEAMVQCNLYQFLILYIFFCILKMCFYNHATKNLAVFFLRK